MGSRLILVVDSTTGALIDVAGNSRESGRYSKFAKRILSMDRNPVLNYGVNGGNSLTVSMNGTDGETINLKAQKVRVSGTLEVGGQTIQQIASGQISAALGTIRGKQGEIGVNTVLDQSTGKTYLLISLDSTVSTKIAQLESSIASVQRDASKYITKQALSEALDGIAIHEEDTLEDVKAQFSALLNSLNVLAGKTTQSSQGEQESQGS